MSGPVLIDEIHLTIRIPSQTSTPDAAIIRRTLRSARFQQRLRDAIRKVFREFQPLGKTRFTISR